MDTNAGKAFPPQASISEVDLGQAAAEFLSTSTERRKRAREGSGNVGELLRKRASGQTVDMDLGRKSLRSLIQESPSFRRLVQLEEQLDLSIMRKQQAVKEAIRVDEHCEQRNFRLYVFNTYRSQPGGEGVTSEDVPSWSLRIQGKLLPKRDGNAPENVPPFPTSDATPSTNAGYTSANADAAGNAQVSSNQASGEAEDGAGELPSVITGAAPRCSDVFSKIVVELDRELYPTNNVVEWTRNDREPSSDGFEISRAGSQEFTARIFFFVDHKPPRFRTSMELSRLIGTDSETRCGVFASVWQYVKKHRLQCVDNRAAVRLDAGLKSLLGSANQHVEVVQMKQLFAIVKNHLAPLEPIMIEYDVKLSGDVVDNQDCYDIQVNVSDTSLLESGRKAGIFGVGIANSAEFEALNERHMIALEKLALHKKRRDFFHGFCASPVQFINHLILSQTRDLKVLGGHSGRYAEEERRADMYQQEWVHEAVPRYLLRKAIADTAEDTIENGLKGQ